MTREDLILAILALIGLVMFLYGSNYFDTLAGWTGVLLVVACICASVGLRLYRAFGKR